MGMASDTETTAMNKPRRYPCGNDDRRCTGRERPAYIQAPRRGECANDRTPWRWSAVAAAPGGADEFVPEGRLSLRQVVHGLHQGGRALPRLCEIFVSRGGHGEIREFSAFPPSDQGFRRRFAF